MRLLVGRWGLALCCGLGLSASAWAQPNGIPEPRGFYATLGIGASWPQSTTISNPALTAPITVSYGGSFAAEAGLGYDFGAIRTELTYAYDRASILGASSGTSASGNRNASSVFASAYLDIPTRSRWVPYLGGGIGYTTLSSGATQSSLSLNGGNQDLFGYQAKAGVAYIASQSTDVFLEGTYQGAPGYSSGATSDGPYASWGARVGFRLRFGGEPAAKPVAQLPAEPIGGPW